MITEVDETAKMANCAQCGRVDVQLKNKGNGIRRWVCGVKLRSIASQRRDTPAHKQYMKEYVGANRSRIEEQIKEWRTSHPGAQKTYDARRIMKRRALTAEQYQALLDEQAGRCACCGKDHNDGKRFFIDHDHQTGAIRGLLCHNCNVGIGHLGDSLEGVLRAVAYLSR